ncbi:MAG: hypothetical protein U0794_18635 [Isosphaeraceae bacterium]
MIDALAPTLRRGCSWVWLGLFAAAVLGVPVSAHAQDTKTKGTEPAKKSAAPAPTKADTKAEPKKDAEKAAPAEEPAEAEATESELSIEVYKDERAEKALETFKSVAGLVDRMRPNEIGQIKSMAATPGSADRELIQRFVDSMAARLIDKSYINGLIAPDPKASPNALALRAIKETSANLIDTLAAARQARNSAFLSAYNQALLTTLPKLLDNNLVSRIEAMIVLGQTGDPNAIPIFLNQLKDPNQTIWVKLWAARGLANIVESGVRVDSVVSAQQASTAGKALADFLAAEKEAPWPVKVRALEALGSMRQAAVPVSLAKLEMANAAMAHLADAEARFEVRATAAWALGMVRVNPASGKYNFPLIAYFVGQLAAEIGDTALESFTENPSRSEYLSGILVGPIYQAFNGVDGARESGLLKSPSLGGAQGFVKQVADATTAVARASVELVRAPGGQTKARSKDLGDRIAQLRAILEKSPPKEFSLVPGGPEYRPASPAVAGAAASESAKTAAVAGGR